MEREGKRADASERGGGGGRESARERKGEGEAGRVRARPGPGGLRASSPERERVGGGGGGGGGEVGHVPSSRCGRGHSQAPALGVAREGTLTLCSTSCPARRAIVRGW